MAGIVRGGIKKAIKKSRKPKKKPSKATLQRGKKTWMKKNKVKRKSGRDPHR